VAIEAIKQHKTLNELTAEYAVHATQKQATGQDQQALIDELYRQLGQVVAERDWLKKKSSMLP
jgi:transposase